MTKCGSLEIIFGEKVLTTGSDPYDAFSDSYWSTQASMVEPACVFVPTEAKDVSIMVLISRVTQCPFAVKGGGHTAFAGAASIEDGITVSMEAMNEIRLSRTKKTVFVGPGNRWGAIYEKLQEDNLAVIGGRASDVGLGLVLGGGISHHSNIYGYACDNVASFEVVTASGVIVEATPTHFPDLYWALRGGGNNFGVVTQFELETVPQGMMWGGVRDYLPSDYLYLMEAFVAMAEDAVKDPKSSQILAFSQTAGTEAASLQLEYLKPVNEDKPPAILKNYLNIPAAQSTSKNRTLADDSLMLTEQMPSGHRYMFWAATYKLDTDFMAWLQTRHRKDVLFLPDHGSLSFQAFTVPAMEQMSKKGGNALGISPTDGPLMHILIYMVWDDETKDKEFQQAAQDFLKAAKAEAKKRALHHDFIYLNYASPYQNVIPSYGKDKHAKLLAVSKKYDPKAVFQKLQPGGFKLDGAPYGETI